MSRSTVISIDGMGGDQGPAPVLAGLAHALSGNSDLRFIIHGDETQLAALLQQRPELQSHCEIRHAPDTVSMSEKPSRALRDGRASSMWPKWPTHSTTSLAHVSHRVKRSAAPSRGSERPPRFGVPPS